MIRPMHHRSLAVLMAAMLTLLEVLGCGGDKGSTATEASCLATIGKTCKSNSDCSGCSGGYCLNSGICTRPCEEHADCGCAAGTVNMDITDGKCDVACGEITSSVYGCLMVCTSKSDCSGTATCTSATDYSYCR
jgi:hypothetical protein